MHTRRHAPAREPAEGGHPPSAAPPRRRPRGATSHGARSLLRKTVGEEALGGGSPGAGTRKALFSALENPPPIPAERARGVGKGQRRRVFPPVGWRGGEVLAGW